MDTNKLEHLTILDLREVYACNEMAYKDALPVMREFRDKHSLTDKQALKAFGVAKRIFDD